MYRLSRSRAANEAPFGGLSNLNLLFRHRLSCWSICIPFPNLPSKYEGVLGNLCLFPTPESSPNPPQSPGRGGSQTQISARGFPSSWKQRAGHPRRAASPEVWVLGSGTGFMPSLLLRQCGLGALGLVCSQSLCFAN